MELKEVIKERYSCRKFSNTKVSREKLDELFEIVRLAPSAKNNQPTRIYVVENDLGIIDESTPCRYNASTVLIVCSDKEKAFYNNGHSTYEIDGSIMATHILLTLTNLGIDNIWIDMFDRSIIKDKLNISEEPICLIPIGYKEEDCNPSSLHSIRKSKEELVEYM